MKTHKQLAEIDARVIAIHEVLTALISCVSAKDKSIADSLINLLTSEEHENPDVAEHIASIRNWLKTSTAH